MTAPRDPRPIGGEDDDDPKGFAQMPRWLQRSKDVSPWAKLVYLALSSRMDKHGHAHPSHRLLATECSCSIPTVKRALEELRQLGVVTWVGRRLGNDSQTSNLYTVGVAAPAEDATTTPAPQVTETQGQFTQTRPPVHTDLPPRSDGSTNESQVNESQVNELSLIEPDEVVDNSPTPTPTTGPAVDELFDTVWAVWPRKVEKQAARKAFTKALVRIGGNRLDATDQLIATMTAWTRIWVDHEHRTLDKIPHLASWLNGERWTDELPDVRQLIPQHAGKPLLPPAPIVRNRHCTHGYLPGARMPDGSIERCPHADCDTNRQARA